MDNETSVGELPDGTSVKYTPQTIFLVQTARGKSSYDTLYSVTGDLSRAIEIFTGVTLRFKGQKKRLVLPKGEREVLLRDER